MSKIISLSASNFKKLTAVEITPAGNVITLTGDNGAGKSCILDSIQSALAGGKTIPEEPIRRGEEKGSVTIQLDDYVVTRTFTPAGGTLRVENAAGHRQSSPQNLLDKLVGNLAFDPLAFSRLKSHEQWEQLRELIGLNFEALDQERQKAYDERTVVGRELLRQQVLLKEIEPSVDDAPDAETSAASVLADLAKAEETNRIAAAFKREIDSFQADHNKASVAVKEAEQEIQAVEQALADWRAELKTRQVNQSRAFQNWQDASKDPGCPAPVPTEPIKEKLTLLEGTNARVRQKQKRKGLSEGAHRSAEQQQDLTERIAEIDATKTKMITDAPFPLSELSFDGEQITYRGIRFAQCSDGEKLRVSVAVGMALNPKLRVIFVRDGSLLDKAGLQTIADLAKNNDYQVWLEDARSEDPTAIEIVDGHVKI